LVAVQVGVNAALRGHPLTGLIGVDWRDLPIAQNVPGKRIATLEEGLVVYQRHSKAVPMVQRRVRAIGVQIFEVLLPAWRQVCGVEVCGAVIN
jgi:hypothetical protein